MIRKLFKYLLLLLPIAGLAQKMSLYPGTVLTALNKAGSNRKQLEIAIDHFKKANNPLKLRAIYFLIENMDIHYSANYNWLDRSGKQVPFNELHYPDLKTAVQAFDVLKLKNPGIRPHPFIRRDLEQVQADYLIKNIDHAFLVWKRSPSKNISFHDFCEYLLPYRVDVEPLGDWRPVYEKNYEWIGKKSVDEGLINTLGYVATNLRTWFSNTYAWGNSREPLPRLGALQLLFRKKGACEDIADLVVFAMRSQGIPTALNYVPYWATSSDRHFLNTVFNSQMHPFAFDAGGAAAAKNTLPREPAKVLRITYARQKSTLATSLSPENIPPGFMRTLNYIDVTRDFWPVTDVSCPLFVITKQMPIAYACVFNGMAWRPTWWGY